MKTNEILENDKKGIKSMSKKEAIALQSQFQDIAYENIK